MLGVASCGNDDNSSTPAAETPKAKDITVWLMNGSAGDDLIKGLNTEFEAAHPGVTVKYEVQQWNGIVSRLNGVEPHPPDQLIVEAHPATARRRGARSARRRRQSSASGPRPLRAGG